MVRWKRLLGAGLVVVGLALALTAVIGHDSLANGTTIYYVDADATGSNDGSTWADAFTDLQAALAAAGPGTEIWVAEGTYKPTVEYGGTGDRYRTFQLMNGVALYGGFDPYAGDIAWEDREWEANPTVLSGDIGSEGDDSDNSYHVFYHPLGTDLDSSAVLDGFTITGGNANGDTWPHYRGGGMLNQNSSPTLTNCTFSGNSSGDSGGGMSNWGSSPALTDCTFSGNSAAQFGGGMHNSNSSSPVLTDSTFSGNSAGAAGGGMYNIFSSPTMADCTFEGNSASGGGGIYNVSTDSAPALTNCTFEDNSANYGGGMYNEGSSPALTNCTFEGNSADGGGGMYNISTDSSPVLTNCTFEDNSANYGGGMYNRIGSSPTLTDCTFEGNSASGGGGMYNISTDSSPVLTNCTFEDNSANYGGGMYNRIGSSPTLTDCTILGNSANADGGGMYNESSSPALTNCTFSGNWAAWGGGMHNWSSSSPVLTNCAFEGNSADWRGGGMLNGGSSPTLTNCTFWGNSAYYGGGGMYNVESSSPTLTNSILWGDIPDEILNFDTESSPDVTYSDVQGGYDGEGNIAAPPFLVDPGSGDFHLGAGSPCIDAGNNAAPALPPYDFEGDDRIMDGDHDGTAIVEMGIDETHYPLFVDADATGLNDGSSWNNAFIELQPALEAATTGDEIWVAEGTYRPTVEFGGSGDRYRTFQMNSGVAIYGGFDPSVGVVVFEDRDWVLYESILSGDIGIEGDDSDNVYHVFHHPDGSDLDSTAILDGFTVSGGNASGTEPYNRGGGMVNWGQSPTLANCTFKDNSAEYGGGIYNDESQAALTTCTFSGNSATYWGGGVFNNGSWATLVNCTFWGNSAGAYGGGMHNTNSSPTLTNCTFWGNTTGTEGGAMRNFASSSPVLVNCILWGDDSPEISNFDDSSPVITHSDIQGGCGNIPGNDCGTGNIDADPVFVDTGSGDFHLRPGSPCIDAGSNTAPNLPPYDFEGDTRIVDGDGDGVPVVDMGVDEVLLRVYLPLVLKGY